MPAMEKEHGLLCRDINRSMDCSKMETPRARRKTPLKNAPRREARAQPKENSCGEFAFSVICIISLADR